MTAYKGSTGDGQYGAFSRGSADSETYCSLRELETLYNAVIDFNASRSSSLYQGTKLQASALQALPCIRT